MVESTLLGGDSVADTRITAGRKAARPAARAADNRVAAPSFKRSDVRELDAVTRELLARLWAIDAGPVDSAGPLTFLDSTICPVYGRVVQGAGLGYAKDRGYHPPLATLAETQQVVFSRLHAVVEQSSVELKSAGLAHLPSGRFIDQRPMARHRG